MTPTDCCPIVSPGSIVSLSSLAIDIVGPFGVDGLGSIIYLQCRPISCDMRQSFDEAFTNPESKCQPVMATSGVPRESPSSSVQRTQKCFPLSESPPPHLVYLGYLHLVVLFSLIRQDHFESSAWRFMWVAPTVNPLYNNKLW